MTESMKQGVITVIPKPGKDSLLIDNWRPISLLTIEYKIMASTYANRLKKKALVVSSMKLRIHEKQAY